MIRVSIDDNRILIEGHAGYAPNGYDIVCAAISTLADTLVMSLNDITEDIITVTDDYGLMDIQFETLSRAGELLVASFAVGAESIAFDYPDNVQVRDDRSRRETVNTAKL